MTTSISPSTTAINSLPTTSEQLSTHTFSNELFTNAVSKTSFPLKYNFALPNPIYEPLTRNEATSTQRSTDMFWLTTAPVSSTLKPVMPVLVK